MKVCFFVATPYSSEENVAQDELVKRIEEAAKRRMNNVTVYPAIQVNGKSENEVYGAVVEADGELSEILDLTEAVKVGFRQDKLLLSTWRENLPRNFTFGRIGVCSFYEPENPGKSQIVGTAYRLHTSAARMYKQLGMNLTFTIYFDGVYTRIYGLSVQFDNPNRDAWQKFIGQTAAESGCSLIFKSTFTAEI